MTQTSTEATYTHEQQALIYAVDEPRPAPRTVQEAWGAYRRAARKKAMLEMEGRVPEYTRVTYEAAEAEYLRECLLSAVNAVLGVEPRMLRYNAANREVEVGLTPVVVDSQQALEGGLSVLFAGLTCRKCGRTTWHQFRSRRHFEYLAGIRYRSEKSVADERRLGSLEPKCVFCEKGVPTWIVL